jgi:hypothetical protein
MARRKPTAEFCECGDHAFAPLTKGFVALVSPEDAYLLLERCWRVHIGKNYATVLSSHGGQYVLARRVMDAPADMLVDHRSRDTADCRRSNLRLCTPSQNQANRKEFTRDRDLPKGIRRCGNGYRVSIGHLGGRIQLGRFDTVDAAAAAYEAKAAELFGEFARAA